MLHTLKDLDGFTVHATDGDIGEAKDLYFDDKQWVIRYLVIETGSWLDSKKVLLSPISIQQVNSEDKIFNVSITKSQVKHSPDVDTQKPVSRQYELDYLGYYGYPFYWGNIGMWGGYPRPYMIAPGSTRVTEPAEKGIDSPDMFADVEAMKYRDQDHNLRSCHVVAGYHIEAIDGDLGHVQGMLIDTETWAIRYLIINTSNWWLGHLVVIAPQWIKEVSWVTSKIYVDMTQQQVKDAPEFEPNIPLSRLHERGIHQHYGRSGYWED